jgi:uncharacterized protein (TIGR04255 family)
MPRVTTEMTTPPPHGFSRSPVKKVICSWYSPESPDSIVEEGSHGTLTRDGSGTVSLLFEAPYPGWAIISRRLAEILPACGTGDSVSRCSLVFSDRFLLSPVDDITSLFSLSRFFPGLTETSLVTEPVVYVGSSSGEETVIELTFRYEKNEHHVVHIDFHLCSVSDAGMPAERALSWFETAHAEIHHLFDEMVSDEIITRLA